MTKHAEMLAKLPGLKTQERIKDEMLRVDHAGEYGAVQIYRGQMAALKNASSQKESYTEIKHMAAQESVHLNHFNQLLPKRNIRPSAISPLWRIGGFMMGAMTALTSKENAMACTESVETVIGEHYNEQISYFEEKGDDEIETLKKFRDEELEHLEYAVQDGAKEAKAYHTSDNLITTICKSVIRIAEKI